MREGYEYRTAKAQNFAEASTQFQAFLSQESVSSDLVWIFREDVVSRQYHILVKEPLPQRNVEIAETLFHRGWERGLGVSFEVLCLLGTRHCCYVWLPNDAREAELHMLAGLKMSVLTDLPTATSVHSRLKWRWLRLLDDKSFWSLLPGPLPQRNI
jgi:hypothetical protein